MSEAKIVSVLSGWDIIWNEELMAHIDSGSFYLTGIRFKAGGEKLIQFHQLLATLHEIYPYIWSNNYSVVVKGNTWTITAKNKEETLQAKTVLEVLAEADQLKYVVHQELTVLNDFVLSTLGCDETASGIPVLEFTDPYWQHIVGPAYEFEGFWPGIWYSGAESDTKDWKKRWSFFVTENPRGTYVGRKHNHSYASNGWEIAKGGILAAMDDPLGNPAYRFLTEDCHVNICLWGYDTHFGLPLYGKIEDGNTLLTKGTSLQVAYEMFCLTEEETKDILNKVEMEEISITEKKPIIEGGLNRFDKALEICDGNSFAWQKQGDGAVWDTKCGYDDHYSLRLESDGNSVPRWQASVGQEMFMKPLQWGKQYMLSAYVRTEDVCGAGAYLGAAFCVVRWPGMDGAVQVSETFYSVKTVGSSDWTKVEMITPPVPKNTSSIVLSMELKGNGKAWFDNLLFEEIK